MLCFFLASTTNKCQEVGQAEQIRLERLEGKVSHSFPHYEWVSPKDCAGPDWIEQLEGKCLLKPMSNTLNFFSIQNQARMSWVSEYWDVVFPPLLKRQFIFETQLWFWLNLGTNSGEFFIYAYEYFHSLNLTTGSLENKIRPAAPSTVVASASKSNRQVCLLASCLYADWAGTASGSWRGS